MVRLAFLCLGLLLCAPLRAALPMQAGGEPLPSLAPMLERVTPAVVNIAARNQIRAEEHPLLSDPFFRWFFDAPGRTPRHKSRQSLGSGVIVDAARGYVLTNHHVVSKADQIEVTLHDGRKLTAALVGADPETDVAVLRIEAGALHALPLGDSQQLRVGDFVVAIGNPFGLSQTVTSGIVSALGRSGLGIEGYENFIQTDASINPGNSGGPLVNLRGELVGINTAILAPSGGNVGIGFAIPMNMAKAIMDQLVAYGSIDRGLFGITVQGLNPDLAGAMGLERSEGVVVSEVQPGSAAGRAGLRPGDVIVAVNDAPVRNSPEMNVQMALLRIGDRVTVDVVRAGERLRLHARIADPYADYLPGEGIHPLFAGALLGEVERGELSGVAVGRIDRESPVRRLGLEDDDLLLVVNERRVERLSDLREIMESARRIRMVKVLRGNRLITRIVR